MSASRVRCTGLTLVLHDAAGNAMEGVDWQVAADRLVAARARACDDVAYEYARAHRTLEAIFGDPFGSKEQT